MAFFTELEQTNFKIYMAKQKTLNSQCNLEKEKQSWRNQALRLKSHSHTTKVLSSGQYGTDTKTEI